MANKNIGTLGSCISILWAWLMSPSTSVQSNAWIRSSFYTCKANGLRPWLLLWVAQTLSFLVSLSPLSPTATISRFRSLANNRKHSNIFGYIYLFILHLQWELEKKNVPYSSFHFSCSRVINFQESHYLLEILLKLLINSYKENIQVYSYHDIISPSWVCLHLSIQ